MIPATMLQHPAPGDIRGSKVVGRREFASACDAGNVKAKDTLRSFLGDDDRAMGNARLRQLPGRGCDPLLVSASAARCWRIQ